MRFLNSFAGALLLIVAAPAAAECTVDEANMKLVTILGSEAYADTLANAGTHEEADPGFETAREGLGSFGGRLGRAASRAMRDENWERERRERKESRAAAKSLKLRMDQADKFMKDGAYTPACSLYDSVIRDLKIDS
ncbi:MAG: hypothetical protein ACFBQW_02725 [Sphingomonadaceae bacterium]